MQTVELGIFESAAIGAVVLVIGMFLVSRSKLLRKYCIPVAVVGGLIFAVFSLILHQTGVVEITFNLTIEDIAMRLFFCSVGFMASFKMLRSGGRLLIIMVVLAIALVVMQNVIGVSMISAFGLDSRLGLAVGSMSLAGGHGTSAAYGKVLVEDYGMVGADVVAIASATFGLAIAGLLGGPLADRLIKKNDLRPENPDLDLESHNKFLIVNDRFLGAVILLFVCCGAGTIVNHAFSSAGIAFPSYLGALILGIIVRNAVEFSGHSLPVREIELLGWLSVNVFLAMALMNLKLWQLADLAVPMVAVLLVQTVAMVLFVYFIVFRVTGRNYESAALTAGTMGFGMGATPNAMANLEAVMKTHGPAPKAYLLIPLIGGVFMDLINVSVLTTFLNIL